MFNLVLIRFLIRFCVCRSCGHLLVVIEFVVFYPILITNVPELAAGADVDREVRSHARGEQQPHEGARLQAREVSRGGVVR